MSRAPLVVCKCALDKKGGTEACFHAMNEIFDQDETEGLIQIDAQNAFNRLNRNNFLHNLRVLCPELANFG